MFLQNHTSTCISYNVYIGCQGELDLRIEDDGELSIRDGDGYEMHYLDLDDAVKIAAWAMSAVVSHYRLEPPDPMAEQLIAEIREVLGEGPQGEDPKLVRFRSRLQELVDSMGVRATYRTELQKLIKEFS